MKYFIVFLRILLGVFFIFSGLVKLYPIEPFEYNFVAQGIVGWELAPYLARGVIALEIFIGTILIIGFRLKKFSIPLTFALMIFFTIYLFTQLILKGNEDDCGCFGTFLEMTPLESIFKNIFILFVLIFIFFQKEFIITVQKIWIALLLFLISVAGTFILNMPDAYFQMGYNPQYKTGAINFDVLPKKYSDDSTPDLKEGKQILCFFSLNCPHCMQAGFKLSVMKERNPELPIHVLFWGDTLQIDDFLNESNMVLPYAFFIHDDFMRVTGGSVPAILYLDDGIILQRWDKMDLDVIRIENEFGL